MRVIAEYRRLGRTHWSRVLGADGETLDDLVAGLCRMFEDAVEVRARAVTDQADARESAHVKNSAAAVTDHGIRACEVCGAAFVARRRDARLCGAACRQRASRARRAA